MTTRYDRDGDLVLQHVIPRSKTDQFNQGHEEILKSTKRHLWPAKALLQWKKVHSLLCGSDSPVFPLDIRRALAEQLKLAGTYVGLGHSRIGNHSMRSGGATLMFSVGFDIEIIKRRGRWLSPIFHTYIWRDEHMSSHIGR